MLSMCSLVCRLVRGWKQSEATSLISQAATTPGSSLLLHDLSEPDLNVEIGSYVASPYPQIDVLLQPYKYMRRDSYSNQGSQQHLHSAFCQTFSWPEGVSAASCPGVAGMCPPQQPRSPRQAASLFCQQGCGGAEERDMGDCGGLLHPPPPPRMQVLWCDNNRQASLVTPRQTVDLSRWTLFFACEDDPVEHTISVPSVTTTSPQPDPSNEANSSSVVTVMKPKPPSLTLIPEIQESPNGSIADSATPSVKSSQSSLEESQEQFNVPHIDSNGGHSLTSPADQVTPDVQNLDSSKQTSLRHFQEDPTGSSKPQDRPKLNGSGLKTTSVSHGFGVRARAGSATSASSRDSAGFCDSGASFGKVMPLGGNSEAYDGVGDGGEKITILLEARYSACSNKIREDDWRTPVMAEHVCEPYAWKCRGVFGVIAHTTPRRLMLMVEAFFANSLLLDNDLHVTKILTVDCSGTPGRMTEPSTIAECVTPGGYYTAARQHQHGSLLDAARCISANTPERVATPDGGSGTDSEGGVGGSNPNLQRSSSPFTRNMAHSSSFTSSPYRRPHSATGTSSVAVASPLRKSLCTSSSAAGRTPLDSSSPAPPLEELLEEMESARSSVSPEPVSLPCYLSRDPADGSDTEEVEPPASPRATESLQGMEECEGDGAADDTGTQGEGGGGDDDYSNRPPNILVYAANNDQYFEAIKKTLLTCFKKDRYAVYHLSNERAFRSPWLGSASLLVICGDVQAHISTVFIRYLLNGGRVLSICSDFLNVAVPLFGTVEVADSEVVGVRYGRWGSVQFLHHQHCSHSSPHNNRFSTNLEQEDRPGSVPKHCSGRKSGGTVSVEPTHVEIKDTDGRSHCLELRVLATDDTWGAPSLIGAKIRGGMGRGVFSQVHLERGPSTDGSSSSGSSPLSHDALRRSATARREILRDLLRTELKLDALEDGDCEDADNSREDTEPQYTPALLMGDKKLKDELLSRLRPKLLGGRELHRPQLRLVLLGQGIEGHEQASDQASEDVLPVLMDAQAVPSRAFDQKEYFENLSTTSLGRLLLYCEVITSSGRVLDGATPLMHGLVVVPGTQTKGLGRGGNVWLSPRGCLMFSLQLLLPLSSFMGSHLPLLQHIVSLAIVRAIARLYPGLQLQLKWPNDIYMGEDKLGGVLVTASHGGATTACVNIGVGLNLTNEAPTRSLQQLLERQYRNSGDTVPELRPERVLATTLTQLEQLLSLVENRGPEPVLQMYYSCWKHSDAKVTVSQAEEASSQRSTSRTNRSVTITGIDYYGFLKGVDCATGEAVSVHPDGNSFNMLEGLVYTKVS